MQHVQWDSRPQLQRPILIGAFAGWNDAGASSSRALQWLKERWNARQFAHIDPELFFDFTTNRPQVSFTSDAKSHISWPENTFSATHEHGRDIVLFDGTEPQLCWRTFCDAFAHVVQGVGASSVLLLGSSLSDVPHTRPAPVMRHTASPILRAALRSTHIPDYNGPAGITSVLHAKLHEIGHSVASLWTSVPHYVGHLPSPKATLSLIEAVADFLDTSFDVLQLRSEAVEYEYSVSELVEDDEDMRSYVQELEHATDEHEMSVRDDAADAISLLDEANVRSLTDEAAAYLRNFK